MADGIGTSRETILVVDDNEVVLLTVCAILREAGFRVLSALNGTEGIRFASEYPEVIDLLLSDVEMPAMTGPDLGIKLKLTRPRMHVMLMSGFPGGDMLVLNYGWAFIQKPFVARKLVDMINHVLHSPDRSQGSHQYDTSNDDK
jgi:two-component system, cell cycle sensor histidine kinase and response regulator CckA